LSDANSSSASVKKRSWSAQARRKIECLPTVSQFDHLVVVLVRPRNPLNIGAAARAMSNFGVGKLRLVNPYAVAFREARSAVGASELLKQSEEYKTVAHAVGDCSLVVGTTAVRNRSLQHLVRQLDQAGDLIRSQLQTRCVALLFGSEKIGLTNDDFSHCHWLLHIPTAPSHISMNLGQAVAVCLYELARNAAASAAEQAVQSPTAGEAEHLKEALLEALRMSGYVKPGMEASSDKKVRRLILRMKLDAMDAKVFLGMVRQMLWKLRHTGKL
jgi:TrmH family RNA methyltransferase